MGRRLSSWSASPVDGVQDEEEEELSPAQVRDHAFLLLEVKETFPPTHAQKGSSEVKKGGGATPW